MPATRLTTFTEIVIRHQDKRGMSQGPTTGPSWFVGIYTWGSNTTQTLYSGHDIDTAVGIYQRHGGKKISQADRDRLYESAQRTK